MDEIVIVKPSTREDVIGIKNVHYKTWLATYPNTEIGVTISDIEEKFKNRLSEEAIQGQLDFINDTDNKIYLIAKDGNDIVGVCGASIHDGVNELNGIYALPEYQGRGIGKKFWIELQKFFDPAIDTILYVASYNEQAINFYKKLGFLIADEPVVKKIVMPISGVAIPVIKMIKKA